MTLKSNLIRDQMEEIKLDIFEFRAGSEGNPNKITRIFDDSSQPLSFNFKDSYGKIQNLIKSAQEYKEDAGDLWDNYQTFAKKYKVEIEENDIFKENNANITGAYTKYISAMGEVPVVFSADKIIELFTPLIYLANNQSTVYTSLPIQFLGEQGKVDIYINPRNENSLSQKYFTKIIFPDEIVKYTTVGISLYGASLFDESYNIEKIPINDTVANYRVHPEQLNKIEIGVSMLLRYGLKFNAEKNLGAHFSLGAGMSISNKIKPRFLMGGGFSVGKKHMLALDLGGIVGYSDRINENAIKTIFDETPTNVIYSKLKVGFFTGLGYIYQF